MKKNKEHPKYNTLQNIQFLLKDMKNTYPVLIVLLVTEIVLSVAYPVFGIYLPKLSLDLVLGNAGAKEIFIVLGIFGLLMTLSLMLAQMANKGKYLLYNRMRTIYLKRLYLQTLSCDYHNIESEEGQTKYQRARSTLLKGDWSGSSKMTVNAVAFVVNVLRFVIYSGIMVSLNPAIVVILVVLSLVNLVGTRRAQQYEYQHQDESAQFDKKLYYISQAGSSAQFGKDMRLYHTGGWFTDLRNSLISESGKLKTKIQNRYFAAGMLNAFILFLRDGVAYAYLIYAVVSHQITVPEFTLYFGAVTAFSDFVGKIVYSLNELNGANLQMNSMRAFFDTTDQSEPEYPQDLSSIADNSIEFQDVCFTYPKDDRPVLDHFNLTIRPGEKVALVGVNGAGKTTTVKLLCGFYEPDSGRILVGGQDICRFKKADRRKLFAAVFQDIFIPPFTVAENVSLQDAEDTDREKVQACLQKAGLWEKIASYEKGMDTVMTRKIDAGAVLSGGQQQKLLMARALYKDAPILILDEPTAALDPIAESETYEQFDRIASKKTALYISHRLASTRFCDKIALVADGKIAEEGTHQELMAKQGLYYEMFTVQSQYYQNKEDGNDEENI